MNRRALAVLVVFSLAGGILVGAAWSADQAGGARRGASVIRLLGDLDANYPKYDADGDGKVSDAEFSAVLSGASNGRVSGGLASTIYQTFDTNGDGHLSLEELKAVAGPSTESAPTSEPPAEKTAAAKKAAENEKKKRAVPVVKSTPPESPLEVRPWTTDVAFGPAQLDALLASSLAGESLESAPLLSDEQYLRRVSIDLMGKPPTAAELEEFLACDEADKRATVAARLLDSPSFARHWGHFWKDVMQSKASSTQVIFELHRGKVLEDWIASRLEANRSWAEVAHGLIAAEGVLFVPADDHGGNVGFLLCHTGQDSEVGRATDTTRIFLGIQLECAQCHDHPTDIWKREQFHELAAYFGRTRDGQVAGESKKRGVQLTSATTGEYAMPDKYDASKTTVVHPRFFLNDEALTPGSDDLTRRKALANLVTSSSWFAKAFVNRVWGQLMGRGFVEPLDDLGPSHEPIYPEVLEALARSFRDSDHNVKQLMATIVGSRAYQQVSRFGESRHDHLHFAGSYPMRMRGEELWDSVAQAVGPFAEKTPLPDGLREVLDRIRDPDFFTIFKRLFDYDPSLGPNDVEPSVAQALMLLNNPAINAQIAAVGDTPLARIVERYADDDEAVRQVYLQVVSRQPTPNELTTCREYMTEVGDRGQALEDLMWALVNSAEFRVKH